MHVGGQGLGLPQEVELCFAQGSLDSLLPCQSPLLHPGSSATGSLDTEEVRAFAARTFVDSGSKSSLRASLSFLICGMGMIMIILTSED